ncbi:MAG: VCBS domain-containing protein, partial [Pararheinheimera sp.]|nr:VCBS domain-containing protein [Rheinheimera sp.]
GTSANNTLTYSLTGADADLLTIDAVTGEVRLKNSADFETKASYSFTVVATDSGNRSSSQAVTVNVVDQNDNSPTVTAGPASATVVEAGGVNNTTAGTDNATITFSTADLDTVGNLVYDTAFLIESGWTTTDGGLSFSKTGTYGTATFNLASGVMSYVLNNSSGDTQALTAGQLVNDTFAIRVTDGLTTQTTNAVFTISGSNDAPTVVGQVPAMAGTLGQLFSSVTLPDSLFTDLDGSETGLLVWSIENLPAGLVFDPVTRTISGILTGNEIGALTLQIVATDPNGGQVRTPVTLTIAPAPVIAPEVVTPTPAPAPVAPVVDAAPQPIEVVTTTLSSLPQGTVDSAGGSSGFAVAAATGSSSFSTIEAPAAVSPSTVVVNVGADGQVQITQAGGDNVNSSLTVANMAIQADRVSIKLTDTVGAASFSATLADGSRLPDWVSVNPVTGEVTMTPPPGQGKITLRINAVDKNGAIRVLEVEVDLENLPKPAEAEAEPAPSQPSGNVTAFMSLDQQLSLAAGQADDYGSSLMKLLAS